MQQGQRRWSIYRLASAVRGDSPHKPGDSPHKPGDSPHKPGDSPHKPGDSPHSKPEEDPILLEFANFAREQKRLPPNKTRQIILSLCDGRYLTNQQIAVLLKRHASNTQDRFIGPMVKEGLLVMKFPGEPNRPDQAYTKAK